MARVSTSGRAGGAYHANIKLLVWALPKGIHDTPVKLTEAEKLACISKHAGQPGNMAETMVCLSSNLA